MHMQNTRCYDLIEKTADALKDDIASLMLLAVQRDNVRFSVKEALKR